MWDYDKLFAEGNIVGVKWTLTKTNNINTHIVRNKRDWHYSNEEDWTIFWNAKLDSGVSIIQYIIRLDEHGNVVEKLFDREKDMKPELKPMPELKTGMFIKIKNYEEIKMGFVYAEENHVIYQEGGYDFIYKDEIMGNGIVADIVEVYSEDACAFDYCDEDVLIWRDPYYQAYLDSKSN